MTQAKKRAAQKQPAKPAKPKEKTPSADTYPAAPTDPQERQEFFWRRNAGIAGVPVDEYLETMRAQRERVRP